MATMAADVRGSILERRFRFAEHGTTLARDTMAGVTTFIVMSYIIFLNPIILSFTGVKGLEGKGLPFDGVLTATCVVAGVMTIVMGLYTNRAYAIAPGLGLNAVVAFQLVATEGLSFPAAMGLILLEGAVVTAFVLTGLREQVMRAIPLELKKAIAIGIGLFIAFIGLYDSGIVARGTGTPVTLGSFTTWSILVAIIGLVITIGLRARGFRGDLLVGIIGTTIIATIINWQTNYTAFTTPGVARWPSKIVDTPNWSLFGNFNFDAFSKLGVISALVWVFALFLSDFFDTMGTLVGVGKQAGYLDKEGNLPDMKKPLLVDSLAAMAGGAASTSSATTYIESGAGVGAGGRTGWVAVIAGAMFLPFIFIAPLIGMVPAQATAAALIIVGYLMISSLTEAEEEAEPGTKAGGIRLAGIDFHDLAIGLPAALVIIIMPLTYSITNGIGFGFIAYTLIRAARGEWRKIHPLMWAVSAAFTLYFFVPLLQTHVSWI
ncbi:MAG: adenine/guanine/hypoxanthine permease [Gaiellaceae bacterium]|jgi:AGZA family xanthine/uracil permease-like MFS transporter|nr:adenine/guanine/hypoxanthine permease [Gaiellaceae bacterium]MDX6479378.1 adenine/guanine/hypoxanthine permease [Gaiellaceae bacterium]MDX6488591.1 adenine/guanine/hypoxanthine permease [Gaiellaceae bacterium]MDX6509514.1 adenine/guanine/hypoxanthine permease [Gaiellaceae bacterium]MDX6517183.1 adenine/guanine/hypoxanthine permease [Gaiellaceae bacterium]